MRIDSRWVGIAIAVVMVAGSTAVHAQPAGVPQTTGPRGTEMNPGMATEVMEPMTLTDEKVKSFFDAADELRAKGKEGKAAGAAKGGPMSAENLAIITKHGFKDATEFQRVGFNVGMARSVLQQGGKEAVKRRIEKAKADQTKTMDQMRSKLTPEQMKLVEAQASAATGRARAMENIPDENLVVVKKYEDRMKPNAVKPPQK